MIKIVLLVFLYISSYASANYKITYKNITLGDIKNMDTIKEGYLIAVPASSWMKYILGFDKYALYEDSKKPKINGDVKYKKDKYMLLTVIYKLGIDRKSQILRKNNKILAINCYGYKCNYIVTKEGSDIKDKGHIYYDKQNNLQEICDYKSSICIKK